MIRSARAVSIKQLPEKLDVERGQIFFRELGSCMSVERPCIVFDCSMVREMDQYAAQLLLCCLEGAIKRNGDVRLAMVYPAALIDLAAALKALLPWDKQRKSTFRIRLRSSRSHVATM